MKPTLRAQFHRTRHSNRGFSLLELMAVVVIVGLLALAAVSMFSDQLLASKGTEAASHIEAIRAAEQAYKAENQAYLSVSGASQNVKPDDVATWYPQLVPTAKRSDWVNSGHPDYPLWQQLAPAINRKVLYNFLVFAGGPGTSIPSLKVKDAPAFGTQAQDWFVIQARGDVDGDSVFSLYASTSLTNEIYVENEGE